jgi:leucine dehydrogenase
VKHALGKDSLAGLHIALQGAGSVATGSPPCLRGRRETVDRGRRRGQGQEARRRDQGTVVRRRDPRLEADVLSPNALGAIFDERTIAALKVPVVAGGANNQLATPEDGERLHARGILYAPDYVINAGGIINVCTEYLGDGDASLCASGSRAFRSGSSRSGPRARHRAAIPPRRRRMAQNSSEG